ncbi:S-layer homology domain-containing protein [Paenibacillus humicola]|uniref:S-layer homology domain-containing protein n=1 Tax=Paenibacillus humicola TaxID=3110540 RepID=UPI00237B3098|nr:S-layer homology domain-containing protein [Paenibacillus humicola]
MIRKQAYVSLLLALVLAFGCICPAVGHADSSMDVLVTADNCKDNSGWYPGGTNDGSPLYNDYVGSFGDTTFGISRCELKFDLSSVVGQITGVQLALFEDTSYSFGSPDLIIGGSYDDAWPLSSGADAYIPAVDETNLLHDTTIDAGWNHFESAQLTQFIVNQANGDKTATLILEGSATSGDNYFGFHSTNNADQTIWPRLIVTYNPVVYAYSAAASAVTTSPIAGAADAITLTVKDSTGAVDTTFSGAHNVSISGYEQAPDNSFGSFGGTTLNGSSTPVSLNFTNGVATADLKLNQADPQTIALSVADLVNPAANTIVITPAAGNTAGMKVTTDVTAPAANGGPFAQQPVVALVDAYGNKNPGDNSTQVTASKLDGGAWTLTGTTTVTANAGAASFSGLGADNDAAVNGAKLAFNGGGLAQITSAAVNLPAPAGAQSATASAAAASPVAGAANAITLNVRDAKGHPDTTFSGAHQVTISGYGQAPGGSYGSFGGTALTAGSTTVSLNFTSGTASADLALNKAGLQTIAWSVAGVAAPDTNTVDITPAAGTTAAMNVTTQPAAPAANGGPFAQQPVITLVDAFGNTNSSDNATQVTASEAGGGGWTLTGTSTATANAGVVSFSDLGAANDAAVTGAQVAFDAAGLVQAASLPLNLPGPAGAQSVAVSAQTVTPAKGEANTITLTVKDSLGHTDTSFSGAHSITISGYAQAPDGTYGSFGGTTLNGSSTAVSLTFTSGTASAPLKLNKAGGQTISFSVTGVQNPAVSIVITPKNDAPAAAVDGPYVTNQSTPLTVAAADGVLRNDTDADSDNLTAVLVTDPSHGSLVLNPDGSFTYSPDAGYYGTDQFTYKANDGQADSNPAAVSIQINDTIPPDSPGITLNPSGWTNGTVTATVYGEPGGSFEYRIGSDPGWTAYTGPVSLTAEGEYPIEARQTDAAGNVSGIGQAAVRIDKTAPVITLNGDDQMSVYLNETFTDPGAAVTDNLSTGLQATAVGSVDTHTLGNYVIHYQAADLAGNAAAEKTRTVHVIAKPLGLSFNATEYTVQLHQTIPFSVAMNYSDGSSVDVTASSSYTFNPEGIASIPSVGVLSGEQAGSTVVKAVYGTDSATVNVVVNPLSANADLSSLTLSSGTLSPAFSPSVTGYDVTVKNSVSSVTVTAAADDHASTVSINGAAAQAGQQTEDVPLHVGRNKLNVIVTSPSGGTKTYSLDIWRNNPSGNTPGGPNSPSTPSTPSNPNPPGSSVDIVVNGQVEGQIGTAVQDTAPNGQTRITYTLDEGKLSEKLDQEGPNAVVTIPVDDPFGQIIASVNGQIVSKMGLQGAVLRIQTKSVTYTLPIRQLNLDRVMHQLGIDGSPNKMNVFVNIANLTDGEAKLEAEQETKAHLAQVAPPITFSITATNGDKTIEIDRFDAYVSRTFIIPGDVDPAKITTGVVWTQDGTFHHVPTKVTAVDGHYEAEIHSLTNSTYAVVYHAAAFPDVERHWSKDAVNNMASRLIISGKDDTHFDPDGTVTRSEFIAILARAMGLASYTNTPDFTDVVKSAWYYDSVAVGLEYELISGYADHTFKPNEAVTREEAMLMMARAAKLAGQPVSLSAAQQQQLLGPFKDASHVGSWAREAAAYCVQEGIVLGSGQLLHPQANLTRAEAAAMTLRLLTAADLI